METEKKSSGAMVGLIIIIILLFIGGIYVWQTNKNTLIPNETLNIEDSSELDTLEIDLQTTDIDIGVDVDSIK